MIARANQKSVTPADHDTIVAMGELASSRIVAAAFAEQGLPAVWVDARKVLVTDAEHMAAAPDMDATCGRVAAEIAPVTARGEIPVLGGFIGATAGGVTTTLGRGGSDYSAAIFGACAGAGGIQIWTDVDGMLTADPRIVDEAEGGPAPVVRRSLRTGVFRRQGAPPEHRSFRRSRATSRSES